MADRAEEPPPQPDWRQRYYRPGSRVRFQLTPDGPLREGEVLPAQGAQSHWLKVRETTTGELYYLVERELRD